MSAPWDELPIIDSVAALEAFGVPAPKIRDKVLDRLSAPHIDFIAASPLVMIGTATPDGRVDVSPKGDPAGFVKVLDEETLVIPDRPGNNRMDGFHNILANPHIGLLFMIPGRGDTLRVNGEVRLVTDGPFFDDLVVGSHRPPLALVMRVEEVFFHCPKAFMRSKAWKPDEWRTDAVAPYAELAKRLWCKDDDPATVDRHYAPANYEAKLYNP